MILRVVLLLVLLAAAGSWLYFFVATPEPGYVLVALEGFRFESRLWFTLALIGRRVPRLTVRAQALRFLGPRIAGSLSVEIEIHDAILFKPTGFFGSHD